jgi:ATP-binding cassette subfamily B protein
MSLTPPIRRLLGYAGRYRRAFVRGFVCVVAASAISLAGPWILKYAIDDLTSGVTLGKVRLYAVALLALAVFGGLFRFLMRRIIIGASRQFEYDLRNDFFAALQRLDVAYFQRNRTGDLMSRATNDLNAVRMMIGPAVMYTASTALTFIVAIVLMVSIDARLTLIALIPLPFVSFTVRYFGSAIHRRFQEIQEELADISNITQESLAGVRVVRAYGQEPFEIERFRRANEEYVRRNRTLIRLQGFYFPSMGLLMGIGALLVLWLGGREVIGGRMTVGELVAFNSYLTMLAWPMIAFGWVTNLLQRGTASWKRMLEVLDAVPTIDDREAIGAISAIRGDIEIRHLTFAYGEQVVLHDLSATIPAGTTTAIVGATGSGKSTLLGLLPRLHDAPAGTVFIDGIDVRRIPLSVLRGAIGFVPQEPFLFSASIADNIAFGMPGRNDLAAAPGKGDAAPGQGDAAPGQGDTAPGKRDAAPGKRDAAPSQGDAARTFMVRVERAAAIARLDKDIADFPQGYDTIVGERGITLSGGQKQRTAIARALVIDPTILILDDALSAVDTYTEEEILHRLTGVMRERTSIIVSHRISTVRDADQILVLDRGRIVERGTHDELIRENGVYAELYRKQLLEEELAAS